MNTLLKKTIPFLIAGIHFLSVSAAQPVFELHSSFWINLHHFLYYQALLRHPAANAKKLTFSDSADIGNLDGNEKRVWQTALSFYATKIIDKDLLFDTGLVRIKNALEDEENEAELRGDRLPTDLQKVLNSVADSYRSHFWSTQNLSNQQWIISLQPLLLQYQDTLTKELGKVYLTAWPAQPIRVDITNYASWSGAYTSESPSRITISSTDTANQQIAALEVIFHEASHLLIDSIAAKMEEISKQDNKMLPGRAGWHAVLFYTTGEMIRRHFKGYIPYAYKNGLWKRAWPMYVEFLEKDWQPYLNGDVPFAPAITKLVRDIEIPK